MRIFVIKDAGVFKTDGTACVVLPSVDGLEHLLARGVLEPVPFPSYTEDERTAFIRDYTACIASLNSNYKDKSLWWATDISSKNRYSCPLPDLIQELLEIERGLQTHKDKPLLIISSSIVLHDALRKLCIKHSRQLLWPQAGQKIFLKRIFGSGISFFRLLIRAIRFYSRSLLARLVLGPFVRRRLSPGEEFYVIKTFSYPSSWDANGDYTDAFFGRLPRILSKDNNVIILSYHWQGYLEFIKHILNEKTLCIFPVEFFISGSDIFRAVCRILTFHLPIGTEVSFRGLDISDILRFELARTLNGIQIFQLLHYDAVRHMLKQMRIKTFLFTFENNPWERMCVLASRHHSPTTQLIGYQHSVVPQAALNMFVHPLEKDIVPLPDRILTTGEIPKDIIQYYSDYGRVPIMSACALRYEYLFQIKPGPRQKYQGRVLLVLDGVEQTRAMLKCVLDQLGGHNYHRLRVRCHPALPWGLLSRKCHFDLSKFANIEISKGTLQEDLAWSDMIIYWQSTVVLEAISMGKPVINFETDDILSYDPLFESDHLKWTINQEGQLVDIIAAIGDMDESSYQRKFSQALTDIKQYFHPASPSSLELFSFDSRKPLHYNNLF